MKKLINHFVLLFLLSAHLSAQDINFTNKETQAVDELVKLFSYHDPDGLDTELGYSSYENSIGSAASYPSTFNKVNDFGFSPFDVKYDSQTNEVYSIGSKEEAGFNFFNVFVLLNADTGDLIKETRLPNRFNKGTIIKDQITGNYILEDFYINPNDSNIREFRISKLDVDTGNLDVITSWAWVDGVNDNRSKLNLIDQDIVTGNFIAMYLPAKGEAPIVMMINPVTGKISNEITIPLDSNLKDGAFTHAVAFDQQKREIYISNSEYITPDILTGGGNLAVSLQIYKVKLETNQIELLQDYGDFLGASFPRISKMVYNHDTNNIISMVEYLNGPLSYVSAIVAFSSNSGDFLYGNDRILGVNPRYELYTFGVIDRSVTLSVPTINGKEKVFNLYPNPADRTITLKTEGNGMLEISTLLGKVVLERKALLSTESIDVSNLSAGTFIVKITDEDNNVRTSKLVIK